MEATEDVMLDPSWGAGFAVSRKEAPGFARFLIGKGAEPSETADSGDCVGFAFGGLGEAEAKALEEEAMGYLQELPEAEWAAVGMEWSVVRREDGLFSQSTCVTLGHLFPDPARGWD